MRQRILFGAILSMFATPAYAEAVPTAEAGAGFAAMGILAAGNVFLRKRKEAKNS